MKIYIYMQGITFTAFSSIVPNCRLHAKLSSGSNSVVLSGINAYPVNAGATYYCFEFNVIYEENNTNFKNIYGKCSEGNSYYLENSFTTPIVGRTFAEPYKLSFYLTTSSGESFFKNGYIKILTDKPLD